MNAARLAAWCKALLGIAILLLGSLAGPSVYAQLENPSPTPDAPLAASAFLTNIKAIAAGEGYTCALTTAGGASAGEGFRMANWAMAQRHTA